ncbi:hypothetical protein [Pseudanabaena yagii]|uniref:Competence protein CoiA-like family protein n=1 Tax=Pseudanabaena yagii GIHE-NHR1 TaxID=2722753 RepID=A0ABX1M1U8_9CYAN|nr:hypothetical protein [Pseudanabaena yagii]NMF61155.1 hypothetical protein [Pseudanabaena yagii GIHE-NHR1]
MQKAYLVVGKLGRQLIDAEEVNHSDFSKIFQCPECNATLHWRSSFIRDGHSVRASFIHPKGSIDDCSLRVDFGINSDSNNTSSEIYSKGQKRGKLEISFLNLLHYYQSRNIPSYEVEITKITSIEIQDKLPAIQIFLKEESLRRQININSKIKMLHSDPFLLIQAAAKVLELQQACIYIENKIFEFEKWLNNHPQSMSYVVLKEQENTKNISIKELIENSSVEDLIKYHCRRLIGIIRYIQTSSDEMRRDFLAEIIWGDPLLPIPMKNLWDNMEIKILENWLGVQIKDNSQEIKEKRLPHAVKISKFDANMLKQLCTDFGFMSDSFAEINTDSKSPNIRFIKFILSKTWQSIRFCDWSTLPDFYI